MLDAYHKGQEVSESLFQAGGDPDATDKLKPYFTGPLLEFYVEELARFERTGMTVEGRIAWSAEVTESPDQSGSAQTAEVTSCIDYSKQQTLNADGTVFDRGFNYTVDTFEMRKEDAVWKVADGSSQPSDEPPSGGCG